MEGVQLSGGWLTLPCYEVGPADREPPLVARSTPRNQPIYPYPTIESYAREPKPRRLRTVCLENAYLKLTFVPELNARLYSVVDKLAGAEVLYANPELKPGLVGLRGVWHATGIEVNFPCSHTVTTVDEISCDAWLDAAGVGHFAAWDVEAVSGMAWQSTTKLAPDRAAFEMTTRLANPTDLPHRYYLWVNAAFPILPDSRFVFPPSTRRIFCEGSHCQPGEVGFLDFPIHDGLDLSLFANLKWHSPLFAEAPDDGFFGLHHESVDRGIAHIADPSTVHGRKIWTWGFAPDGEVWHDVLTDTGGPYCEVQSGPLRHQNEYRSLGPGQLLTQAETWLPLRGLGGLSYATSQAAASWSEADGALQLSLLTPVESGVCRVSLVGDEGSSEAIADLSPTPTQLELTVPAGGGRRLLVRDETGRLLLDAPYDPPPSRRMPTIPAANEVTPAQKGRRAEWHGDRLVATEQYQLGAEESPLAAAGLARQALERADSAAASRWSRRAMALDWHDPEAVLTATLAARLDRRHEDFLWLAEQLLGYPPTRAQGLLLLVDDALAEGEFARAVARGRQLYEESGDIRALGRLCHALRRLGDPAARELRESAPDWMVDPLLVAERRLADPSRPALTTTAQLAASELYHRFGDRAAAIATLEDDSAPSPGTPRAMLTYAKAYVWGTNPTWPNDWPEGFAHGQFAIRVLRHALREDGTDQQAQYHLGCALAAAGDWEQAESLWAACTEGPHAPEANRNLGLSAHQNHSDLEAAAAFYRQAMTHGGGPRTLLEQDQVLHYLNRHGERLAALRTASAVYPDDTRIPLQLASALLSAEQPAEALAVLEQTAFQLAEGGSLPQRLWRASHERLAEQADDPAAAAEHYRLACTYPSHLGVGRPAGPTDARLHYRCGLSHLAASDADAAREAFERGADPGQRLQALARPARELAPEAGPPQASFIWALNELFRARCLFRLGQTDAATVLLDDVEAQVKARDAHKRLLSEIQETRAEQG